MSGAKQASGVSTAATVRRAMLFVLGTGAVFAVVAIASFGGREAWSVLVGSALGAANLYALGHIVRAVVPGDDDETPDTQGRPALDEAAHEEAAPEEAVPEEATPRAGRTGLAALWSVLALLKIAALFGGVWAMWKHGRIAPMATVLGYGSLPVGLTVFSLVPARRSRRPRPRAH
jgi:hypothetical protein